MFEHRLPLGRRRRFAAFLLFLPALVLVLGTGVMWLWNALMPVLFGLKAIHFWQAVGLLALTRILFGGFHGGHHRDRRRCAGMDPEQRARFRVGFHRRFGAGEKTPA